jgi:hypothetical protein
VSAPLDSGRRAFQSADEDPNTAQAARITFREQNKPRERAEMYICMGRGSPGREQR